MDPFPDPTLRAQAEELSSLLLELPVDRVAPDGWSSEVGLGPVFAQDRDAMTAFQVATRGLGSSAFGRSVMEEWREDFAASEDTFEDFVGSLGFLQSFEGRNFSELLSHYLSVEGVNEAGWQHLRSWVSNDGQYVARLFSTPNFRPQDSFLHLTDIASGNGWAVPHGEES